MPLEIKIKNILILCPLKLELEFLLARLKEKLVVLNEERAGNLKVLSAPLLNMKFSLAGHGKTQFGIQTQFLISHYKEIEAIFCIGCAGGLSDKLSIGDIVVAEKTLEHDFKLRFFTKPIPEFLGDPEWLQKISSLNMKSVHFGIIASGDEDIVDTDRAAEIRLQTGALAVAWEGAGGARASQFNSLPFVEIRGITDLADLDVTKDFKTKLQFAMNQVADLLLLISKY